MLRGKGERSAGVGRDRGGMGPVVAVMRAVGASQMPAGEMQAGGQEAAVFEGLDVRGKAVLAVGRHGRFLIFFLVILTGCLLAPWASNQETKGTPSTGQRFGKKTCSPPRLVAIFNWGDRKAPGGWLC
jgi:hypothetical protein